MPVSDYHKKPAESGITDDEQWDEYQLAVSGDADCFFGNRKPPDYIGAGERLAH